MVLPNGPLFAGGVAARIKKELLEDFNLHTIVRLPNGVFSPYTSIPTNLLFFQRDGPTEEIWYYELPLPTRMSDAAWRARLLKERPPRPEWQRAFLVEEGQKPWPPFMPDHD